MSESFLDAVKQRRTYYALDDNVQVPATKIKSIVREAILHCPSGFNAQSTRAVVLIGDSHKYLWDAIVKPSVKAVAPSEVWPASEIRLNRYVAAYGTVMLFEDTSVVENLKVAIPLYAKMFDSWSEHANAMIAFVLWTAFELEGLGASLQHYNPLIDDKVREKWNIPATWSLKCQLVFGNPLSPPGPKTFKPIEERLISYGC